MIFNLYLFIDFLDERRAIKNDVGTTKSNVDINTGFVFLKKNTYYLEETSYSFYGSSLTASTG